MANDHINLKKIDTFALPEDQRQQLEVLKWLSVLPGQRLQQASEASPVRCLHACYLQHEKSDFNCSNDQGHGSSSVRREFRE